MKSLTEKKKQRQKDSVRRRITTGRRSSKYQRDYWQNKGKNHERGALEEG